MTWVGCVQGSQNAGIGRTCPDLGHWIGLSGPWLEAAKSGQLQLKYYQKMVCACAHSLLFAKEFLECFSVGGDLSWPHRHFPFPNWRRMPPTLHFSYIDFFCKKSWFSFENPDFGVTMSYILTLGYGHPAYDTPSGSQFTVWETLVMKQSFFVRCFVQQSISLCDAEWMRWVE